MRDKQTLGYSDNSPYKNEPSITIDSNKITMKNTSMPLFGLGYKNGKFIRMVELTPGKEYDFGQEFDQVVELPKYQTGGFSNLDFGMEYQAPSWITQNASTDVPQSYNTDNSEVSCPEGYSFDPLTQQCIPDSVLNPTLGTDYYRLKNIGVGSEIEGNYADTNGILYNKDNEQIGQYNDKGKLQITNPNYLQQYETNPYGGVSLENSLYNFGKSIGDKDPFGIAAYGALSAMKLGRIGLSGYSTGKRNRFIDQYYDEKKRQGIIGNYQYTPAFQDGGEQMYSQITEEDLASIKGITGIPFTLEGASKIFQHADSSTDSSQATIDDNSSVYKNIPLTKDNIEILRMSNYKSDNPLYAVYNKNIDSPEPMYYIYDEQLKKLDNLGDYSIPSFKNMFKNEPSAYYQKGGEYKNNMDEYLTQTSNPNAEVEKDEYTLDPQGNVQKVVGNTHEDGGVDVNLQNGTKIVSDHLQIGNTNAKELSKKYNIKTNAKDTYASVIEKIDKKSGLQDLLDNKEEILKKVDKQNSKPQDTTTKLNLQFLQKKLLQLDQQKKLLEKDRASVVDYVFKLQEESKPKGSEPDFTQLSQQYNMDASQMKQLYEQFKKGGLKKYQDGELFVTDNTKKYSDEQKLRIQALYKRMLTPEAYNKFSEMLAQDKIVLNDPYMLQEGTNDFAVGHQPKYGNYYGNMRPEDVKGWVLNDYYKSIGKEIDLADPVQVKQAQQEYLQAAKDNGIVYMTNGVVSQADSKFGNVTGSYVRGVDTLEAKQSGTIDVDMLMKMSDEKADAILAPYGLTKKQIVDSGKVNQFTKYLDLVVPTTQQQAEIEDQSEPSTQKQEEQKNKLVSDTPQDKEFLNYLYNLPDQSKLPPSGLEAPLKTTMRLGRAEPNYVSPEQALQSIKDSTFFASSQADKYADSQRQSFQGDLLSKALDASNNAILQTQQLNQAEKARVDTYNTQKSDLEEQARINSLLDFEAKMLKAKNVTEQDYRNYLDYNRAVQVSNYNAAKNLQLLNQMYPNMKYDQATGMVNYNGNYYLPEELFANMLTQSNIVTTSDDTEKKEDGGYYFDKKTKTLKRK